jgi:hypothetical protein
LGRLSGVARVRLRHPRLEPFNRPVKWERVERNKTKLSKARTLKNREYKETLSNE